MRVFFNTFSRVFGFLIAIVVFIILINVILILFDKSSPSSFFRYQEGDKKSINNIAILSLNGPIISEPSNFYNFNNLGASNVIYPSLIIDYLEDLKKSNILGLIVSIDSPGGSVSASHTVYRLFKNFQIDNNIPIYFHSSDMLASGAYWVALAGSKIFTNYGAIIGSIGVKGPDWIFYNSPISLSSGLLGNSVESKNEIKLFTNTAGKSKDILNPFRIPNIKEKKQLNKIVNNVYADFVNLVSSNRKIENEIIINEIGAMIYDAKQAKELHLIDNIKNLNEIKLLMINDLNLKKWKIIKNDTK